LCILYLSIFVAVSVSPSPCICILYPVSVPAFGNVSCELSRDLRRMTLISKMPLARLRESEDRTAAGPMRNQTECIPGLTTGQWP